MEFSNKIIKLIIFLITNDNIKKIIKNDKITNFKIIIKIKNKLNIKSNI
jgi:hypothetical protein